MARVELLTSSEVAEELNENVSFVLNEIRKGNLKAKKYGKCYKINREDLNQYMGISNEKLEYEKDIKINKLEAKVKHYEFLIRALYGNIDNLNTLIEKEIEHLG